MSGMFSSILFRTAGPTRPSDFWTAGQLCEMSKSKEATVPEYRLCDSAGLAERSYRTPSAHPCDSKHIYFDENQQLFSVRDFTGRKLFDPLTPHRILCAVVAGVDENGEQVPSVDDFLSRPGGAPYKTVVRAALGDADALKKVEEMCDWDMC
jgi:hypothetical protein